MPCELVEDITCSSGVHLLVQFHLISPSSWHLRVVVWCEQKPGMSPGVTRNLDSKLHSFLNWNTKGHVTSAINACQVIIKFLKHIWRISSSMTKWFGDIYVVLLFSNEELIEQKCIKWLTICSRLHFTLNFYQRLGYKFN